MKKTKQMNDSVSLFLGGDVMTGRGVDQIMPVSSDPVLHESYVKNANDYVNLAEKANGAIKKPVSYDYIWGYTLSVLNLKQPDARIINLETSISKSSNYWKSKGIHYRMHPENVTCLTEVGIDCCTLANNHVLDWGYAGLTETILTLNDAGIKSTGAGADIAEASEPAVINAANGKRILVFSYGLHTSGIPKKWMAMPDEQGVNLLPGTSAAIVHSVKTEIMRYKNKGDVVVFSIHWGGNWEYKIADEYRQFAHELIDSAGVDVIHGHSSHHFKEIEVYNDKLILYGCGDLINDYEGIKGHEAYRDELGFMYFPEVDVSTGKLEKIALLPTKISKMQLNQPVDEELEWMTTTLNQESSSMEMHVNQLNGNLFLEWENKKLLRNIIQQ